MNLYLFLLKIKLDSRTLFDTQDLIAQYFIDPSLFYECFPSLCARNQPTGGISAGGARCQNGYLENGQQ